MCRSRVRDVSGLLLSLVLVASGTARPADGQTCGFLAKGKASLKPGVSTVFDIFRALGTPRSLEVAADDSAHTGKGVLLLTYDVRFAVPAPQPAVATFWVPETSGRLDSILLDFRRFDSHVGDSLVQVDDLRACFGAQSVRARRGERDDPNGLYGEWLDCADDKGRLESVVFLGRGVEARLKPGSDVVDELWFEGMDAVKQWWLVPCGVKVRR